MRLAAYIERVQLPDRSWTRLLESLTRITRALKRRRPRRIRVSGLDSAWLRRHAIDSVKHTGEQ